MPLSESDIGTIRTMVQDEVKKQQEDAHIENTKNTERVRKVQGKLYTEGFIPDRYLPLEQKGRAVKTGHRANLVDIDGYNGHIYYNVSVASDSVLETKFKQTQMFELTFQSEDDEADPRHGEAGIPDLVAMPIKSNVFTYAFQEIMSTYTPDSYDKMKGMPFCQEPPAVKDMLNKMNKINPDMVVLSAKKSDGEIENNFKDAMRKSLGLGDDDELPPMEELAKEHPEEFEEAKKKAMSNIDRPSLVIDKSGIVMANPKGKGRMTVTKDGLSTSGNIIHAQKPDVPMDLVGINTFELPINDMMPKGNVFTVHPQRLPKLDEILSLGLMAVRFVTTTVKIVKVIADFSKL